MKLFMFAYCILIIGACYLLYRLIKIRKKKKIAIVKSVITLDFKYYERFERLLIFTVIALMILLISWFVKGAVEDFNEVCQLLIPDYFSSTFEVLNIFELESLMDEFIEKEMISEAFAIIFFQRSIQRTISIVLISLLLVSNMFIFLNLRYNAIDEKGIYFSNCFLRWSKITNYKRSEIADEETTDIEVHFYRITPFKKLLNIIGVTDTSLTLRVAEVDLMTLENLLNNELKIIEIE